MLPTGTERVIDFTIVDIDSNPVPGRTLAAWQTSPSSLIFLRNMVACSDNLSLKDYGDGRYSIYYTPSTPGHDYVQIFDQPTGLTIIDTEDIVPADFATGGTFAMVTLNQNYGGTNNLQVSVADPTDYTLYIFRVEDWNQNQRSPSNAVGLSALDSNGNWLTSVQVVPGYYNIVIQSSTTTQVLKYNFQAS